MKTLIFGRREIMSNEADGSAWTAIVGAAVGVGAFIGSIITIFWRGLTQASARGRSDGVLEAQVVAIALRLTALEVRKDRIDAQLIDTPGRKEMREGFDRLERQGADNIERLERQIETLSKFIHEDRGTFRPRSD